MVNSQGKKIKVAINGFGRIGRLVLRRMLHEHPALDVVAINDLADVKTLAHLFKYDSNYGAFDGIIEITPGGFLVKRDNEERMVNVTSEKDPLNLPWKNLGVDIVLECTGFFTEKEGANKHLQAGSKKAIISAPSKSEDIPTYLLGVNEDEYKSEEDHVISMGSCTTNCLAPVVKILHNSFGIERGFMTTVHSYTNDQNILDLAHKDSRRARAAALNIIPTTTGATKTVEKCLPELKGKLDGLALRVPTATVSIIDFVCLIKKTVSREEINEVLKSAATGEDLSGILAIEDAPLVSSDYKGSSYSAIVDALSTQVIGNLVKVLVWYDNEWGYACRLAEMAEYVGKRL